MSDWQIYAIGLIAQILFSGRLLLQWLISEKHKKVLTPSLFWKLSLLASFLLYIYGYLRDDFAIMLGQAITYYIYIRNLQLQGEWQKAALPLRILVYIFPLFIVVFSFNNNAYDIENLFHNTSIPFWLLTLGTIAQLVFNLRFFYQWIYSEKKKQSILPLGFWILSLIGALLILVYAFLRKDPILFIGHFTGSFIYIRNIILSRNSHE
ncbi:lipid-A-disaccharide synthase N-terminal domain-containing protein [Mesonia aestuariivivens]|uniref:Lipid-A-disaccharide synthase N-terminal domain-containing protein n=1 Tax=Mesonia aestuariivivens TaxID=2796128 RepID=A0ABS6W400_9FLAO|nr:lipid-A-disaccharide synthase N-terminal domain-containing protein [Mesonia aestuariivivens]MBW2962590.1 lipid-A-disaccharide synthase N-terminal domain-containing protein [Mesonia aestuariivivens]